MELSPNFVSCERECEGISYLASERKTPRRKDESSSLRKTLSSFCSEQVKPSAEVFFAGKPEGAPSCEQFSKIDYTAECRSEIRTNSSSGNLQMSSFERACYEDFQTYIPEIATETQFIHSSNCCEDNPIYGCVSPSGTAASHGSILTHYSTSSSPKVTPSTRHCFYNEGVEYSACEAKKSMVSNPQGNYPTSHLNENLFPWHQEIRPSLPENLRFSRSPYSKAQTEPSLIPPNKVVNHFPQPLCPTVSIRVDISCPLSSCNCKKMSCCCRDSHSKSPVRLSHGNLPGKRNHVAFRPNVFQTIPSAGLNTKTNSFAREFGLAPVCSSGYNADLSKYQMKSDCHPEASFKYFSQRFESNNNGCLDMVNFDREAQNGHWMADDQKSCQRLVSDNAEKKFAFQSIRGETFNPSVIKYDENTRWNLNYTQPEHFSVNENSSITPEKHNTTNMTFPRGSQAYQREFYFPKTVVSSYCNGRDLEGTKDCTELMPVNPEMIFGQCRFQTTANNVHEDKKYCYPEPTGQMKTWQNCPNQETPLLQAEKPVHMRNKRTLNDTSLVMEPSSPIANLSNLVAKIHPDHGNIMTGKKNPKLEGNESVQIELKGLCNISWRILFHVENPHSHCYSTKWLGLRQLWLNDINDKIVHIQVLYPDVFYK